VVLARNVVDRETAGKGLNIGGLGALRRVWLTGLTSRFKSGYIFGPAERKEIALLGGVDEVSCVHDSIQAAFQALHRY
jgi:hypothetical protein